MAGRAADALGDVNGVVEIDIAGQACTRCQWIGLSSARLARTGASICALVQSCEWQVMQVSVGGMPAKRAFSTEVWQ